MIPNINSETVCELLRKIVSLNFGLPITLVLDNAKYQKCVLVQNLAAALNIELLYLPPYSPHLNLIERLWKFVKKNCLYSKYYSNFTFFKEAITSCLSQTHTTYKKNFPHCLHSIFSPFLKLNLWRRKV
jgi:transposase